MRTPQVFLAYAPRGPGLRCALACLASERDVYGWFIGPRHDGSVASRYFLLEDFHANAPTRYEAVEPADLHSPWPLDEARRHELAAMQEAFAREWLVFDAGRAQVRADRLGKFSTLQPTWTYYSQGFERPVLKHLTTHWPLEYRLHMERTAAAQKRRHAGRARP